MSFACCNVFYIYRVRALYLRFSSSSFWFVSAKEIRHIFGFYRAYACQYHYQWLR